MSGSALEISIRNNVPAIQQRLDELVRKTNNPEPAFKNIGEYLVQSTERRFSTETGPNGLRWKPVRPATRKRKRHQKILSESLRLRRSIVYRASRSGVAVGTNVIYAAAHQFGDREPHQIPAHIRVIKQAFGRALASPVAVNVRAHVIRTNLPQRAFLGVSISDRRGISEILGDFLTAG